MSDLDLVGIGSMALDRVHRSPRVLGPEEKAILRDVEGGGPVALAVGGVMLNQLGWAAALGLRTGITGRQGDDETGRFLRDAMDRNGIERHLVQGEAASTLAEIFVADDGGRAIYMAPGATLQTTPAHIRADHADFIRRAARFSTEISQVPLETVREALRVARAAGIPTVVDFDVSLADALATLGDETTLHEVMGLADILKPSKAAVLDLLPGAAGDPLALARGLRERFGCKAVVLTDGEEGCTISTDEYEGQVGALDAKLVDTTGAGDAFLGGLLVALHHGLDWESAGLFANACGAACCEQLGAFPEDAERARARILELYPRPTPALAENRTPEIRAIGAEAAQRTLAAAALGVQALAETFDGSAVGRAVDAIRASGAAGGRLHVTGVGKPEHVARYAASLFSSTGTPATFLHATEATHGSLGQVVSGDVVIAISNSGETAELLATVEALAARGVTLIGVTGRCDSSLARASDLVLEARVADEGGPLGLAPRVSIAAEVLVLAALSSQLQEASQLSRDQYALLHPAGALGAKARAD